MLALGLGLAWTIAGSLSRPLRGLARTARQIAAGDLRTRATPTGSAEQVEVANAFNDMTDRLVRALDAQRDFVANASHQLRTPLTGLRLRLESASLRAEDPDLKRDLAAGELETERLAKLLSNLLRLAQDGQPATTATSIALARRGRARSRPLARPGRARRPRHRARRRGRAARARLGRRPRHHGRQPRGERLELHRTRHADPDRVGRRTAATPSSPSSTAATASMPTRPSASSIASTAAARAAAARVPGTGLGLAIVDALAGRWGARATLTGRAGGGTRAELRFPAAARRRPRRRATRPRRPRDAMTGTLRTAILAVVGLALAVAVGLAANAISRDSIGLAPTPVGSGVRLAPAKSPDRGAAGAEGAAEPKKKSATNAQDDAEHDDDDGTDRDDRRRRRRAATTTAGERQGRQRQQRRKRQHGGAAAAATRRQRRQRQQRRRRRRRRRQRRRALRPARRAAARQLRRVHRLERDGVAADPLGRLAQRLGHGVDRARLARQALGHERRASRPGSTRPAQAPAGQQRHREVAVHALGRGHVGLEAVLEVEDPQRPRPIPHERVEGRQQRRAMAPARWQAPPAPPDRPTPASRQPSTSTGTRSVAVDAPPGPDRA